MSTMRIHTSQHSSHVTRGSVCAVLRRLDHRWSEMQVGRQGKYSIERLESFEYFCNTTSTTKALLWCVLTPLPALITVVLMECLPLRAPSEGWSANWVFWLRFTLANVVQTVGIIETLRYVVPDFPMSAIKELVVSVAVSTCYSGFFVVVAKSTVFPIPCIWQIGFPPYLIIICMSLLLAVGTAPFKRDSPCRLPLQRFHSYFLSQGVVISLYPLLKVVYDLVPSRYQGLATLLLTVGKFGAQKFIASRVPDYEDLVPQIVAFRADFFVSLFVTVCMFKSGSPTLTILVFGADICESILAFRELRANSDALEVLLQEWRGSRSQSWQALPGWHQSEDLVVLLLGVCRDPAAFQLTSLDDVRLWACIPHTLPSDCSVRLKALEIQGVYTTRSLTTRTDSVLKQGRIKHRVSVRPSTVGPDPKCVPRNGSDGNMARLSSMGASKTAVFVRQGLQLLFHCEYLILVEYVECIIPVIFVAYKSVLHALPNVVYYPGEAGSWSNRAVGSILVLAALEMASFLALNALVQRKFSVSPLYQLAFTLKTQAALVFAAIAVGTLILLPYELQHQGIVNAIASLLHL